MAKILLVEDDPILGKNLFLSVRAEDHDVNWVQRLGEADAAVARSRYDLLLLDAGLPDGDGIAFCRRMREGGYTRPIVILTAQGSEESAINGLNSGANDFVRKPYGVRELLSRIRVLLYGAQPISRPKVRHFGGLEIDLAGYRLVHDGREIALSSTKLEILNFLVENEGRIVSREALLQHLNKETEIYDRTVDAHISQLRRVLRANGLAHLQIASIYGAGYKIENLEKVPAPR